MFKIVTAKFSPEGVNCEYRVCPWINADAITEHLKQSIPVYGIVTRGGDNSLNNMYVTIVSISDAVDGEYNGKYSELIKVFTLTEFFEKQEVERKLTRVKELIKQERKAVAERMELTELAKLSPALTDLLAQLNTLEGKK
jgi:hypothetical protein